MKKFTLLMALICVTSALYARDDIDAKNNRHGNTALMLAAENGYVKEMWTLLKAGANTETMNNDGWTALMFAARGGQVEAMEALIEAWAEVEAKDQEGRTLLIRAARDGDAKAVKVLIRAGAHIEARDNNYRTALMYAAVLGHGEVARALVEAGADIEAEDNDGKTATMFAEEKGHEAIVATLAGRQISQPPPPDDPPPEPDESDINDTSHPPDDSEVVADVADLPIEDTSTPDVEPDHDDVVSPLEDGGNVPITVTTDLDEASDSETGVGMGPSRSNLTMIVVGLIGLIAGVVIMAFVLRNRHSGKESVTIVYEEGGPASSVELDIDQVPETDILFECPHCQKSLSIDRRGAGLIIACTVCQLPVTVPIPEDGDGPVL